MKEKKKTVEWAKFDLKHISIMKPYLRSFH